MLVGYDNYHLFCLVSREYFTTETSSRYLSERREVLLHRDDADSLIDQQVYDEYISGVLQQHVVTQRAVVAQTQTLRHCHHVVWSGTTINMK